MFSSMGVFIDELAVKKGKIVGFEQEGMILVRAEGCETLLPCHFIRATAGPLPQLKIGDAVLCIIEPGHEHGYIIGIIEIYRHGHHITDEKSEIMSSPDRDVQIELPGKPQNVRVNGKKVFIAADDELHLKCGKGTIIINRQGKIVVRGTEVVSRSSGTNKIKGAAVGIN